MTEKIANASTIVDASDVEHGRLGRSLELDVERLAPGRYRVSGGSEQHWVDLFTTSMPRCDCGDHLWRDRVCKRILAALLREGSEPVVKSLADLVRYLRERTDAERRTGRAA